MARAARTSTWFPSASTVEGLGVVLHRFTASAAHGTSFVMVHGLGVSSRYFEALAAELSAAGTVWLVDLPGYGDSPRPDREVALGDHARALGRLLTTAGIEEAVLIGHSWGCQVITALADQRPDASDRLVLLSPTVNPARRTLRQQFSDLLRDAWLEPGRAAAFALYSYLFTGRIRYYLAQLPQMIEDRVEERLVRLRAPTLVVSGTRDPIVPQDWAEQVARLLENGRLQLVPGAHVIMYTSPGEIAAHIEDFVR